jgi:WXXGXW repeat (2 copies)
MPSSRIAPSISSRSLAFRCLFLLLAILTLSIASSAQFRVAVTIAPPALPIYDQPVCPGDGYIWTPGYWYWDDDAEEYYWVPGTWVLAPEVGFYWTPGWWGWGGSAFIWNEGFWGPEIGFYGGIDYGFGYFGVGFVGGRWEGGHFFYNQAITNVNVTVIHNVYNETVVNRETVNRISYNGPGGIDRRPTAQEEAAMRAPHVPPVPVQRQHVEVARRDPQMRALVNQGKPPVAATQRPGELRGEGVVPAREAGAPYHPPARGAEAGNRGSTRNYVHAKDLGPAERGPTPNTGDAKLDEKYQKEQAKLAEKQDKERMKLQKQQDKEHEKLARQQASQERTQQLEQRHQQQTQRLQQRQMQQTQHLQARQAPARSGGRR